MSYWIYRKPDDTCLAVEEAQLDHLPISDDLGEMLFDVPMPQLIARICVSRMGGKFVHSNTLTTSPSNP